MKRHLLLTILALIGALFACVHAGAQVAAPTPATESAAPEPPDTTIELSPFVVNADADVGYQAANTLAGSRLNTSLKDTAATIGVLTSEFLADVGATNIEEALEWGNNVQMDLGENPAVGAAANDDVFSAGSRFRVRGVDATLTRNYFEWNIPADVYNIERIEESRGPNSILFGIGSAGGIVNTSTKQALTGRSFLRAGASVSSFGGHRGTFDANLAAFDDKLGMRVNAVYDHTGSNRTYGFSETRRVHLAAKYRLTKSTQIRAEYETGDIHANLATLGVTDAGATAWLAAGRPTFANAVAANAVPNIRLGRYGTGARVTYIGNDGTLFNMASRNFGTDASLMITDEAIADRDINPAGPGQLRDSHFNVVSVFVDQRLWRNTYLELGFNHQDYGSRTVRASSSSLSYDPNLTLPTGASHPFGGRLMFDSTWIRRNEELRADNARLSLSTELDFGQWGKYRLAGLGEYQWQVMNRGQQIEVWAGAPFNSNSPEAAVNQVFRRSYVNEGDWGSYYVNSPKQMGLVENMTDPVTGRTLSSTWVNNGSNVHEDPTYQTTLLLGGQARYFKDRLVLGFGYREDRLDQTDRGARRNPNTNQWEVDYTSAIESSYSGRTSTIGAVFHVTRNLSLLYNRAENFALPNLNVRVLPDEMPAGNPEGKGEDMGIAVTLLEGRLYARAVKYSSKTIGNSGKHGFGNNNTSPLGLTTNVLDTLVANGLLSVAEADSRRVNVDGVLFDRASEGYEFSLTANPTKNWRMMVNYSYTSSFDDAIGVELAAWAAETLPYFRTFPQGLATPNNSTIGDVIKVFEDAANDQFSLVGEDLGGLRKQKVSIFTRYSFSSGLLKGAFIGGGYRHQSKNIVGRAITGEFIHGPSYWEANALLGYRFSNVPVFNRMSMQLNVSNLFDDQTPRYTQVTADGLIRRWRPIAPRTWRLSANVEF